MTADDIEVVFYNEVWEAIATKILVHKQVAILIETPAYLHPDTTEHVNVSMLITYVIFVTINWKV